MCNDVLQGFMVTVTEYHENIHLSNSKGVLSAVVYSKTQWYWWRLSERSTNQRMKSNQKFMRANIETLTTLKFIR